MALAEHQRHLVVEVDVLDPQPDALAAAHAGRRQQADDGGVAAVLEGRAGAGRQQALELLGAQHRRRIVGNGRRAHAGHRRLADLVLVDQPAEDLLEGPID